MMKRRMSVSGAAAVLLLTPLALRAQTIKVTPRTSNAPDGNMCLQISAGPSLLSGSPEGEAFIRMRAEVEAVERAMGSDSSRLRRMVIIKGRLDTLGRLMTGSGDPSTGRMFFEARPGALVTVEGQRIDLTDPINQMMVNAKLRELQPQVAELARSGSTTIVGTLNIRLHTLGYIGLTTSAGTFPTSIDPMQPFAYCDYPLVESVEPGSPAEKAGLLAGDTLIAYNNRDLRQTNVNYPDLLVPGKKLAIKYRRDGKDRQATMRVAARDSEYARLVKSIGACTEAESANGCRSDRLLVRAKAAAASPNSGGVLAPAGAVFGSGRPGVVLVRPATGFASDSTSARARMRTQILVVDGTGGIRFAGALIRAIDEQTAQNLGTDAGLQVIDLPANTSSYQAGLRAGDWVVSANGSAVRDINTFLKAFESKVTERLMTMQVTSKSAGPRTVAIRW